MDWKEARKRRRIEQCGVLFGKSLHLKVEEERLICAAPEVDHSTHIVETNSTFAQYACRAGYRFESGDLHRSCDANGTWSGVQLVCAVDSILPKTYLVILIVGATIAVFLACIPYDFYRFRKRKKKVRDHQERLSLVTRIAPGHAKVVVETLSSNQNPMGYPQGRRFGFKSLFSVFRFVGGKMRSTHGHIDATNPVCADEQIGECDTSQEQRLSENAAAEPDGAKASSFIFDPPHEPSCPSSDVIDLCPLAEQIEFDSISRELVGEISPIIEEGDTRPRSSSPLVMDTKDGHDSIMATKKGFQMFKKANEIFSRDSDSRRHASLTTSSRKATSLCESEPATVEITAVSATASSGTDDIRGSPLEDITASKVGSPVSSTSSPEAALLKKGCLTKVEQIRTFHYPSGKNSVAYHSMPTISDIP